MKILKAGTILINKHNIGLIYRDNYDDYTFPKGHIEKGETPLECAIRETNEETKREVIILKDEPIYIEEYDDSEGNTCHCEYFLAKDNGVSDNKSLEVHELVWVDFNKVESLLSYESLRVLWRTIKEEVLEALED